MEKNLSYDNFYKYFNDHSIERIEKDFNSYLKYFPLTEEDLQKSILDVGTGTGHFITYIRDVLNNKKAFGIEIDSNKLDGTKEGFIVGDGIHLPFADGSFEIVTAKNYLSMFLCEKPEIIEMAISELIRVTRPGGKILTNLFNKDGISQQLKEMMDAGNRTEEIRTQLKFDGLNILNKILDSLKNSGYHISSNIKDAVGGQIIIIQKP